MNSLRPLAVAVTLVLAGPPAILAQASDAGVLVIRAGDRDVGTENFTVVADSGLRITSKTLFTTRPAVELTASMDQRSGPSIAFQLERRVGSEGAQVYAVQKRNRITIRRVGRGAEQASEVPGGPRTILLADSVFALYLQVVPYATEAGQSLTALFPQGARRVTLSAQRVPDGTSGTIVRLTGGIEGEIFLGNDEKVQRISLPALSLVAARRVN